MIQGLILDRRLFEKQIMTPGLHCIENGFGFCYTFSLLTLKRNS